MYFIYMIRCTDNSIYTGIAKNICKRMKEHYYKLDNCAKYTRTRDVYKLEMLWFTQTRSDASKLEYSIKHLTNQQKENLILEPESLHDTTYEVFHQITLEDCLYEENTEAIIRKKGK